jgi:hypothetical protein
MTAFSRVWLYFLKGYTAHLVVVGCGNEYNGAILGNVERPSWSYLPEEYVGDSLPKEQSAFIGEIWGHERLSLSG